MTRHTPKSKDRPATAKKAASKKKATSKLSKQTTDRTTETTQITAPPRTVKEPAYRSFHLRKSVKPFIKRPKLVAAYKLFWRSCAILGKHWKLFGGILLIYALFNIVLVGGVGGGTDLQTIKQSLGQTFTGHFSKLSTGLTLFAFLVSSNGGSTSSVAGAYQTILLLIISLVVIWALRQTYAGAGIRIRDAFYGGVYPLIPFFLVLLVVVLQLLPLILGFGLYSFVIGGGIAVYTLEKVVTVLIVLLLIVLSLYMVSSSIFALYVVTLPDMTPMKALRSARELVKYRRWIVLRKILFLPLALLVVGAIIIVPLALLVTSLATVVFFVLTIITVAVVHSYMYALYRELLA